jgi:hypothetical protein
MIKKQQYHFRHKLHCLFLLLLMAWLTACLPYVNESRQTLMNKVQASGDEGPGADSDNPLSDTNEEKSESGTSLLSEFLSNVDFPEQGFTAIACLYKCHPSGLYTAYHPERIIPPPEAC